MDRGQRSGSRRLPLVALLLGAVVILVLAHPERRTAALAALEGAAEWAGLGLQQITVVGHRFASEGDIYAALDLDNVRTLLSLDARAAQARIEQLSWIERASIDRIVPDGIEVRVVERVPFAVWRSGERHWLVDRSGRRLQVVPADAMRELLRVTGDGAAAEAAAISAQLFAFPQIAGRVDLAERVGSRRWTLHLAGGMRAHLPATGEAEALARLARVLDAGRDGLSNIDLRAPARVLVREGSDGADRAEWTRHPSNIREIPARSAPRALPASLRAG